MSTEEENVVWKGRSHQIVNFWPLVIALLVAIGVFVGAYFSSPWLALVGILPLAYAGWLWLGTKLMVFELTSERIRIHEGILNQQINEVELYRVKDTKLEKPFWMRVFGLSSIVMTTSDRSLPKLTIPAVRNGIEIREKLRKQVELLRDKKRVREVDFEGGDTGDDMDLDGDLM